MAMKSDGDAIALHSRIAGDFDAKYTSSPMFRERLAVWQQLIGNAPGAHGDVLDAGCGSGVLSLSVASTARYVLSFDGSAEMIALARQKLPRDGAGAHVDCKVGKLNDPVVLAGRKFDLILCSSVLEYAEDWWQCFDWLSAALNPSGDIIFSLPNGDSFYRSAEAMSFRLSGRPGYYAFVRNVPRLREVRAGLAERGFVVTDVRYYGAAPVISSLARPLGMRRMADTLFAVTCRRHV
jgi:SAM-dependent methyltransferase